MSFSSLPLSYCTNVHSGLRLSDVKSGLTNYTVPISQSDSETLSAGLWLAEPVTAELLAENRNLPEFADWLHQNQLSCHTLNAFPYGNFHEKRVKENVYIPDWADPKRLAYTQDCATILAGLIADETIEGSISTVPLGFKGFTHPDDFEERAISQLLDLARWLNQLRDKTGRTIRLAIEPEPFCLLETTEETIRFFHRLRNRAADSDLLDEVENFLGVCYDVCHQSVEFEDVAQSIQQLAAENIHINKVHITCAIQVDRPADNPKAREALARYVEPRYLHQTMGLLPNGNIVRAIDLTEQIAREPDESFLAAETWRVHFHVPVDAEQLGPLKTTRPDLRKALQTVAALNDAPHLEIETYTWEVLPDGSGTNLVEGLSKEISATRQLLAEIALGE
ncbi:MAG: metabolite traffic protein EboE [Planctomycetaceae bacterium]